MNLGVLTLVILVFVIALGAIRKLHVGVLAIAVAVPLGRYAGIPDGQIISGWNTPLSVMLMGVTFLFGIAQTNGTLELFARKTLAMAGKRAWAIPIVIFFLGAFLASIGPGTVPVMTFLVPLGVILAVEMGISPLMMGSITILGCAGGGLTPIAPTGIIGLSLAAQQGFTGLEIPYALNSMTSMLVPATIYYFFFGGHKLKGVKTSFEALPMYDSKQKLTMAAIAVMVLTVLVSRVNVGLAAFVTGAVLVAFKAGEEKDVFKVMPWSTILLVCGVGVLMNIAVKLKGIELLAKVLASFMNKDTATTIMTLSAGIMSWFASTSGVVMPTLIPTMGTIIQNVPGTTPIELISAITFGAHVAGTSPVSTGGGLAMAGYSALANISPAEQYKLFLQMFALTVVGVFIVTLFAATGAFTWFNWLLV